MRTAITIACTHKGQWELISTPDVPLLDQRKAFREIRAKRKHPQFALVMFQESDGAASVARLLTPQASARIEATAKAELDAFKERINPKAKTDAKKESKSEGSNAGDAGE